MIVLAAEGRVRLPFVLCTDGTGGDGPYLHRAAPRYPYPRYFEKHKSND
jgi:hypothetical protein